MHRAPLTAALGAALFYAWRRFRLRRQAGACARMPARAHCTRPPAADMAGPPPPLPPPPPPPSRAADEVASNEAGAAAKTSATVAYAPLSAYTEHRMHGFCVLVNRTTDAVPEV